MLVQFGNHWIQKIPLTANLAVLRIFHPIISKLDKHVVLLHILIAKHLSAHLKFSMRLQREAKTLNYLYNLR